MHRTTARHLSFAAAAVLLAACSTDVPTTPTQATQGITPVGGARAAAATAYLVTFKDDVADVAGVANEMSRRGGFALDNVRRHAARGFTAHIPPAFVDAIRNDPRVAIFEPDGVVTLDLPRETARPGGGGGGQQVSYGLTRVGGAGDGTGKTAWIIDTGIDLDHPDLNTTRSCHRSFTTNSSPDDGNGHGTHVAGTIAAKNNSVGTLGVAPNAFVCAVRVLGNNGSGQWSWIVAGVDYVAANGANGEVANMSLGGSGSNATLEKAVSDAAGQGIKFAIAAGNSGAHAGNYTPARVNGANIYTVSAVNSSDCMASWSNYGNPPVDYAAPGVSIISTWKGGGTKTISGTSMASPHVAGILLLGSIRGDGTASCDPDGNPDPIAHR